MPVFPYKSKTGVSCLAEEKGQESKTKNIGYSSCGEGCTTSLAALLPFGNTFLLIAGRQRQRLTRS